MSPSTAETKVTKRKRGRPRKIMTSFDEAEKAHNKAIKIKMTKAERLEDLRKKWALAKQRILEKQ